jgi:glucose-6-phosphate-specific signal transduction histidine kinase
VAVPEERFSRPVEAAAYFLVAEACETIAASIGAGATSVEVKLVGDRLMVDVTEDGGVVPTAQSEAALTDVSDRVGALDGHMSIAPSAGRGLTIRAEIPCGS